MNNINKNVVFYASNMILFNVSLKNDQSVEHCVSPDAENLKKCWENLMIAEKIMAASDCWRIDS